MAITRIKLETWSSNHTQESRSKIQLGIVGAGYVGLVTALGFGQIGHSVILTDIDRTRIDTIARGRPPFFEPGIGGLLTSLLTEEKLRATCDTSEMVAKSKLIFLCVNTYCGSDGHIDLTAVRNASAKIGTLLKGRNDYPVIVVKCTVVPGTTEEVIIPTIEAKCHGKYGDAFGVAVNPEFLSEGKSLQDFLQPSRIIIGTVDEKSNSILRNLYNGFSCPILQTDLKTAEMVKYASNAALATRISFINEIGNICKLMGIDVYQVAKGIGLDPRIGPHFLQAGVGFGGSCLPKDVKALIAKAQDLGYQPSLLSSVLELNQRQIIKLLNLAEARLGSLKGEKVAILGLAFKPGTDDIREAPALVAIEELVKRGALLNVYDPVAGKNAERIVGTRVTFADTAKDAIKDSNVVFILTDWAEFKNPALYKGKIVFDGRRVLEPNEIRELSYEGIAW